jgi:hypothetical protein
MEVLFTFLAERYERRSVMVTSNLVLSEWDKIFKDPMTTACAIERLVQPLGDPRGHWHELSHRNGPETKRRGRRSRCSSRLDWRRRIMIAWRHPVENSPLSPVGSLTACGKPASPPSHRPWKTLRVSHRLYSRDDDDFELDF